MEIEYKEVVPGRCVNLNGSPVIMKVTDISKLPYGLKNAYRTKSPVKVLEYKEDAGAVFIENADGFKAYFNPNLFDLLKNNGELFLTNMGVRENRVLIVKGDDCRYLLAPFDYKEATKYNT